MSVRAFLKDRFLHLVLHLVCMGMLSVFLRLTGYNGTNVAIILLFWVHGWRSLILAGGSISRRRGVSWRMLTDDICWGNCCRRLFGWKTGCTGI